MIVSLMASVIVVYSRGSSLYGHFDLSTQNYAEAEAMCWNVQIVDEYASKFTESGFKTQVSFILK